MLRNTQCLQAAVLYLYTLIQQQGIRKASIAHCASQAARSTAWDKTFEHSMTRLVNKVNRTWTASMYCYKFFASYIRI
jgi:hypothetical protein